MTETTVSSPLIAAAPNEADWRDYVALLKPRVMSLVVLTGLVGLYLAPGAIHPVIAALAVICIAVGAGASGAINMWFDRDIDAVMARTRGRPIPAGRVEPESALAFGVILAVFAVTLMALTVNWAAGALLALTIGFYVFVYTMWLKRRTPQNIVIGGAAGAFPPMIGWAAVTGDVGVGSLVLFLLIFMWTPPHFWALSLYRDADYARAGVPMLPVVSGRRETKKQVLVYTALLAPLAFAPVAVGLAGWLYGAAAAALSLWFLQAAVAVWRTGDGDGESDAAARRMFLISLAHLFGLFAALAADRALSGLL
ncbi:MAG: protoheme IX farnesyltransferase [Rhodospirillaceae bacterium]|nr:protoheme IX farnesyltransferase [Rhodospirillaceae bacterium]MYF86699.1 protoheme IX farnesyltransferase [Rhodospirillaceae bacterium]MYH38772.1 protoheme IX farnesyltransferase [Rhodospirillaceae bacterium]MYK16080.1 protoheme IX farnesyltransferase [Rhodospirillaceae bacterium]